ncbi:glycosyltransferase family 2 protein [Hydrogenophilus thermoluteolus]|uniref:glycosyltransferase n=1 Tax=Hydrogenophilus thermoluteolus TaxID=297 RepID=UPI003F669359
MTWWWLVWLLGGIPSFYLLLLTWVAAPLPYPWLPEKARSSRAQGQTRFRIVIPAHNEAKHIATTVTAALALDYPRSHFSVLVVANACTDETAEVAQAAGAAVLSYPPPEKGVRSIMRSTNSFATRRGTQCSCSTPIRCSTHMRSPC